MDALLMCGGEGTRLDADVEKPLFPVAGVPMVDRVVRALTDSNIDRVFAVTSPSAPETAAHVDCPCIETPGEGYVADLNEALGDDRISTPVLTVAADLPLLDGEMVDRVLGVADGSLTVVVPVGRKRALGLSVDTRFRHGGVAVTPAGINVVAGREDDIRQTRDRRCAANVNRRADARTVEWMARNGRYNNKNIIVE